MMYTHVLSLEALHIFSTDCLYEQDRQDCKQG
jgi:hypothetical protein